MSFQKCSVQKKKKSKDRSKNSISQTNTHKSHIFPRIKLSQALKNGKYKPTIYTLYTIKGFDSFVLALPKKTQLQLSRITYEEEPNSNIDWTITKTDEQLQRWCITSQLPTAPKSLNEATKLSRKEMQQRCDPFLYFKTKDDLYKFLLHKQNIAKTNKALQSAVFQNVPLLQSEFSLVYLLDLFMQYLTFAKTNANWKQVTQSTITSSSLQRLGGLKSSSRKRCETVDCTSSSSSSFSYPKGSWESGCCLPFKEFEKEAGVTSTQTLKRELKNTTLSHDVQSDILKEYKNGHHKTQEFVQSFTLNSSGQVFLARFMSAMQKILKSILDPIINFLQISNNETTTKKQQQQRQQQDDNNKTTTTTTQNRSKSRKGGKIKKEGGYEIEKESHRLTEYFENEKNEKENESWWKKTGNVLVSGAKKVFKTAVELVVTATTFLTKQGFNLIKYIFSHPQNARIATYIILQYRNMLCRKLSIYVAQKISIDSLDPRIKRHTALQTAGYIVSDTANTALNTAKIIAPKVLNDVINNGGYWDFLKSKSHHLGRIASNGMAKGLGQLPVVGGFIAGATETIIDLATEGIVESAKQTAELLAAQAAISGTFDNILEIVDFKTCFKDIMVDENNKPIGETERLNYENQMHRLKDNESKEK